MVVRVIVLRQRLKILVWFAPKKVNEIHVAGACGIRTKACLKDRFFETEAEVVEYLKAFVQLYREEANYLERVMHFEERVGLDYIQNKLDTAEMIKFVLKQTTKKLMWIHGWIACNLG